MNDEIVEIKAFLPAKNYRESLQFYQDLGFTLGSDVAGIAYFSHGNCSFLLQDFYEPKHAHNFMMHVLVKDVQEWHQKIITSGVIEKYKVNLSEIQKQPWGMLDFVLNDPSGVLWRFAQNI